MFVTWKKQKSKTGNHLPAEFFFFLLVNNSAQPDFVGRDKLVTQVQISM